MRTEGADVAYGGKLAVNEVSLPVRQGEVLALIGPSGCGKTTLLRSLNRLVELTPTRDPRRPHHRSTARTSTRIEVTELRRRVSMVFQQPNPFPMSDLRQRRLRAARAGARSARRKEALQPAGRSRRSSAPASATRSRRPRPPGAAPLRRPAAAALHRPRAGRAARGAAARRALLGARPALDRGDRGADPRAARASWRS